MPLTVVEADVLKSYLSEMPVSDEYEFVKSNAIKYVDSIISAEEKERAEFNAWARHMSEHDRVVAWNAWRARAKLGKPVVIPEMMTEQEKSTVIQQVLQNFGSRKSPTLLEESLCYAVEEHTLNRVKKANK